MPATPLNARDLYRTCDLEQFDFSTTDDLQSLERIIGQRRAVDAVRFGIDIDCAGYNLFALGPPGMGKLTLIRQLLERRAPDRAAPDDWCYVNNFDEPHKPLALRLPTGEGRAFAERMDHLIDDVRASLAGAFESDGYVDRRNRLAEEQKQQQAKAFEKLREQARERGLEVVRTPEGFAFAPSKDGQPMTNDEAQQLPEEERDKLEQAAMQLQDTVRDLVQDAPKAQREARRKLRELNRDFARQVVEPLVNELRDDYVDHESVRAYLDRVSRDLQEQGEQLLKLHHAEQDGPIDNEDEEQFIPAPIPQSLHDSPLLRRYRVNVIVGNDPDAGAPVVYEDNPTYTNVIGRIEQMARMGTLVADFNLIKAGALHRANGGYLILDTHKLLSRPLVFDALKRALRANHVRIEQPAESLGLMSTVTLEPQTIPLDVKVVLLGDRQFYYMLREYDPEFEELFKVAADFEEDMPRDDENQRLYAQLIATLARKDRLRPFDKSAVGRVIEHSARIAGDANKLSVHMRRVCDLLHEADYWSKHNGNQGGPITAVDVQRAIDAQHERHGRVRERVQEQIAQGGVLIDTDGARVGQINGLAVLPFGDLMFGKPNRITARIRMGKGEVIDIEREVALGGPLHSKGVLILAGYISGKYAADIPLSLAASLVFEQSYGGVDGDSASSAELYVLLSAIADVPLKQGIAVTGSVNQHGQVQAIGGVNEKIEGFFDVCRTRGLTGEQGVMIPASNVRHLMLRGDIVQAVKDERFHVWQVESIEQGIELLTGESSDEIDRRVRAKLEALAQQRLRFMHGSSDGDA
jgi:lon-related putative ATP-dependent protease